MILGQLNRADQTTILRNTEHGPALDLRSSTGPALKVNSGKRVKNLNADMLDGLEAADLQANRNATYQWDAIEHPGDILQAVPDQPPGSYLVTWAAQLNGASGTPAAPNIISCRITQEDTSGAVPFVKAVMAEDQLTSVGTPPALNGATTTQPIVVNLLRVDGSAATSAPLGKETSLVGRGA
jgi:hypothetical protein